MCIISSIIFDENLIVDSVTESDAEFQIHFELNDEFVAKHRPEGARLHETRIIAVKDLPLYSNRDGRSKGVVLFIPTIRYKDPVTGKTVTWRPAFIDSRRAITRRLRSEIVRAYDLPDSEIASRLKLSEGTVRLVRKDHYEGLDATHRPVAGACIGIDECHLGREALGLPGHSRKRGLGVITARDGNRILAITPNTKQNTIEEALRGLAGLETVCFVTMDMTAHYRAAVQSVLPRAQIIVDPWHVVMLPTEIVQKERKSLVRRSSDKRLAKQHWLIAKRRHDLKAHEKRILDEWLAQYPVLRELYRLKEEFCAIYDLASNSSDAWERYLAWRQSFPKPDDDPKSEASVLAQKVDHAFATFLRTIDNWRPEILAWFDAPKFNGSRPSQAHAENRNRFIKGVYDRSQGMHYETLRRRMVIGSNWPLYLVPKDNPRPEAV